MNKEIKQRIEQLNNGKIPKGYKKTDFGVFPSDWETDKTLGDLFDFYGGLSKSRDELGEEGYAYLHYGDLHRGTFNSASIDQYEQLPKCDISLTGKEMCLMKDGDVAFLDASEDLEGTSRAVLIDNPENKPFIAGLHIIYGKAKNNNLDKWFKQYITSSESVKKQFQRLAVGFKVYGVNRDTISRIKVAFPSSQKEQSRIADILMKWDKAIELYDKQIDALTRYKAVCLKKMFPIKGQSVPEWRFQGFSGDWEQRKLEDFGKATGGTSIESEFSEDGIYKVISIGSYSENSVYNDQGIRAIKSDKTSNRVLNRNDLTMILNDKTTSGNIIGRVLLIEESGIYVYNQRTERIEINLDEYDSVFLYEMLNAPNIREKIIKQAQGNTQIYVNWTAISLLKYMIPSKEEQVKIGEYLHSISNLITLHQRKKEVITNQRKTLQQYLLNGIIRV